MNISEFIPLLLLLLLLVGAAVFVFLPARASRDKSGRPIFRDDDRYWVGGFLYYNPDDPDVFVPRRFFGGYTVNVGHPLGKLLMIGLVLLGLALAILAALSHH